MKESNNSWPRRLFTDLICGGQFYIALKQSAELNGVLFLLLEIFEELLANMRYTMTEMEKKRFYSEYLKNVKINVTEDGTVQHIIKK